MVDANIANHGNFETSLNDVNPNHQIIRYSIMLTPPAKQTRQGTEGHVKRFVSNEKKNLIVLVRMFLGAFKNYIDKTR